MAKNKSKNSWTHTIDIPTIILPDIHPNNAVYNRIEIHHRRTRNTVYLHLSACSALYSAFHSKSGITQQTNGYRFMYSLRRCFDSSAQNPILQHSNILRRHHRTFQQFCTGTSYSRLEICDNPRQQVGCVLLAVNRQSGDFRNSGGNIERIRPRECRTGSVGMVAFPSIGYKRVRLYVLPVDFIKTQLIESFNILLRHTNMRNDSRRHT